MSESEIDAYINAGNYDGDDGDDCDDGDDDGGGDDGDDCDGDDAEGYEGYYDEYIPEEPLPSKQFMKKNKKLAGDMLDELYVLCFLLLPLVYLVGSFPWLSDCILACQPTLTLTLTLLTLSPLLSLLQICVGL